MNLTFNYSSIFYDSADPRIRDYFLMGDPILIVTIYVIYALLCRFIIPRAMKNREPFRLAWASWLLKNVIFNFSIFFMVNLGKIWIKSNWRCEAIDDSETEEAKNVRNLGKIWFFNLKF